MTYRLLLLVGLAVLVLGAGVASAQPWEMPLSWASGIVSNASALQTATTAHVGATQSWGLQTAQSILLE